MKKLIIFLLVVALLTSVCSAEIYMESDEEDVPASVFEEESIPASLTDVSIIAPCAILIEKTTGQVLFEKNADKKSEPASVTKIMTLLLIAEALDSGSISFDDIVTTSAYAASMGGSQVFLSEGEQMTVREMLKCIIVSSANDASVAMAEFIAGSEQAFVAMMNERAAQLGMENTHFGNCTGLLDDPTHLTTARDISTMSRQLLSHDWIKEFSTIWMDTIRNGEFGLSNTNKLIRYYSGATGLKTGFTSSAGYCLSASAERDGVEYIAVILNCATSSDRFESAKTLLSCGFAAYTLIPVIPDTVLAPIPVTLGSQKYVLPVLESEENILIERTNVSKVQKSIELADSLTAPIAAGQKLGILTLTLDGEIICETDIVAATGAERLTWWDIFKNMVHLFFCGSEP